jgi:hypothetical protein
VTLTAMSELRLALLIAGSVFLVGLAWWEIRRSLRASRGAHRGAATRIAREPVIPDELPAMRTSEWDPPGLEPEVLEAGTDALTPQTSYVASPQAALTAAPPLTREPLVQWPPDEERQILALRLVAVLPERFAGHILRQALLSEGFVLGKFSIFHKPDESGRAVLSAAHLTQPGTFDGEVMDSQRFAGLSLFAVLPGSKSPLEAFDQLVETARALNDRLEGALQDELGRPLTPWRVASLRQSLSAEAPFQGASPS